MNDQATEFWDWAPIRPRRFTLVDLMAIVAMIALARGDRDRLALGPRGRAEDPRDSAGPRGSAPLRGLVVPLRLEPCFAGVWLDTLVALTIILLTVLDSLSVLALGWY